MKNIKLKNIIFITSIMIFTVVLAGGFYYLGYKQGIQNPQAIFIKGISNIDSDKTKDIDFNIFWQVWQTVKEKYVDNAAIDNQALVYGAISGLVNSLKDPYTVFMPPSDAKKFNEEISGEFSGIGAEIGIRNEQLVIIAPLKNSPAERAGIKASDKILKIGDKITEGLTVDEAVKLIRGPKNTKIILTVSRNGWEKTKEIAIIRETIKIPTLDFEIKDDNIAYFHLYNFYENAPFLFYENIVKAVLKNPQGIILDLRNNPGGYLEGAVNIASWFLNPGEIVVSEKFASGKKDEFRSYGSGALKDLPVVVLINEGSASASEILAGALRDNRGAKIIGKKSFGKGTVQELEQLKDGSSIKITTAHWLTPKGHLIDKNGITPDYEVNLTEKDVENKKDPQLDKAMEILKNENYSFGRY
ncbi:S41 family peptidase [Candidatus Wolfebacteria bacterium]|nr:S41 family peptidase [Candidatus Wolfebacteria bacterium]